MAEKLELKKRFGIDERKAAHDLKVRSGFVRSASSKGAIPNGETVMPLTGKIKKLALTEKEAKAFFSGKRIKVSSSPKKRKIA